MTNTFKTTVNAFLAVAMLATMPMAAHANGADLPDGSFEVAGTIGMDHRDDRRDDRQDCRVDNGAGADKRDCKQDNR